MSSPKPVISILADSALYNGESFTGSTVQLYNLARMFVDKGHPVNYHYAGSSLRSEMLEYYSGIQIFRSESVRKRFAWLFQFRFYRSSLNRAQPDVVYVRGRSILCFIAATWCRKNDRQYIWGTNGDDSCEFWKRTSLLLKSQKSVLKKMVLISPAIVEDIFINRGMKLTKHVVNQTFYQAQQLKAKLGIEGVIIPSVHLVPEMQEDGKTNTVLWVGNITRQKRAEDFLAIARACQHIPGWKFILVGGTGDTAYYEILCNRANEIPNLEMTGRLSFQDTQSLFMKASVFVSTSEHEGFSNTFIQAWLSKTPVLSLHHDPDGIIRQNKLGYTFNGQLSSMQDKTAELMTRPQLLAEMGENAFQYAHAKFSTTSVYPLYEAIFIS